VSYVIQLVIASGLSCSETHPANSIPISSSLSKLKETIREALYDDVSVEQFVQHALGLHHSDTQRILDKMRNWDIPRPFLEEYKDAYGRMNENTLPARRGPNAFSAFLDVIEETLSDIRARLNDKKRPTNSISFKCNMDGSKAKAPDITTAWDATSKPDWSVIQTIFEFQRPTSQDPLNQHTALDYDVPTNNNPFLRRSSSSPSYSSSQSSVRGSISSASASSYATTASSSSSRISFHGRKRPAGSVDSLVPKRLRHKEKDRISSGELRLAQKALECMNSAGRRYMTGVYINNCSLTLWYYDRMSAIRSRPFNLEDSPAYFALVLYAITRCDAYQAGFDRFMEFPSTPFRGLLPSTSFKNSRLVVPTSTASYCFKITHEKPVYASCELMGRGTIVHAVTLQPDDDEVLVDEEEQVLKLYWPNADDPCEADVINQIRDDVPEIADHLPAISFSASFTREALNLPSFRLKSYAGPDSEERLLHLFAMRRYEKLWQINSIEEFQEVFLDCVECE